MLDRLRLGYVVDFVDGGIGTFRWYTFNVADAAISAAIVLLFLAAVRPALAEPSRKAIPSADGEPDDVPVAPGVVASDTVPQPVGPGDER
jgi:hypothetical protein